MKCCDDLTTLPGEQPTLNVSVEPSLVVFSMSRGEKELITLLTERLKMYIGVQGTVESLLGAIFEIYLR